MLELLQELPKYVRDTKQANAIGEIATNPQFVKKCSICKVQLRYACI